MSVATDIEPLIPEDHVLGGLREVAHEVQKQAWQLAGLAHSGVLDAISPLLRAMNSYYTNRIEGQHTLPADIEKAMHQSFSTNPDRAAKQRLALAHMETERSAELTCGEKPPQSLFAPDVVIELHRHLYAQLPPEDLKTADGEVIRPGQLRERAVIVGSHAAPAHGSIVPLLAHWAKRYNALSAGENLLIGVACAHHRLAWIHPFLDGNGRVARLHSHFVLHAMGLTHGLWSPMRGLARNQQRYYDCLHNADLVRRNELDGRGPLSQGHLIGFSTFFLETCLDQVQFMHGMLRLNEMRTRLEALLTFESAHGHPSIGPTAADALHYTFLSGPIERSRFIALLGMPERSGRRLLSALLEYGLLRSDSPKGPVIFTVPFRALRFLFPALWPEAEAGAS